MPKSLCPREAVRCSIPRARDASPTNTVTLFPQQGSDWTTAWPFHSHPCPSMAAHHHLPGRPVSQRPLLPPCNPCPRGLFKNACLTLSLFCSSLFHGSLELSGYSPGSSRWLATSLPSIPYASPSPLLSSHGASILLFKHTKLTAASGPLHMLLLQLGMCFPLLPSHTVGGSF